MDQASQESIERAIEQLRLQVRSAEQVRVVGAGTKTALVASDAEGRLSLSGVTGVLEYEPSEFTITAYAGTTLRELDQLLALQGQYMPFDPPLIDQGATIGGTVGAGLSGAGRLRYGGVRDFILGVRLIDGLGTLIYGGGKVVKNAAGFDLPKLMVGSCGRLGVLTEITMKVFPRPASYRSVRIDCRDLDDAVLTQNRLASAPLDLHALDLEPPATLWVRVSGASEAVERLAERVVSVADRPGEVLSTSDEFQPWRPLADWSWVEGHECLIKVPLSPRRITPLDRELERQGAIRRYSVAGNVVWIRWAGERALAPLDQLLTALDLSALVLRGKVPHPRLGLRRSPGFARKISEALDPAAKFGGVM